MDNKSGFYPDGGNLRLMDMIAPFGGQDDAMKELREKIFPGQKFKILQPDLNPDNWTVLSENFLV